MKVDFSKIEESKRQLRRKLAALPYAEKLRILEDLRERTLILRRNSLRRRQKPDLP